MNVPNPNPIDELYKDVILDHYSNPRNTGGISPETVAAEGQNPVCGDETHVGLSIDDRGMICDICTQTKGCSISVASGSMMSEALEGKTVEEACSYIKKFKQMMAEGKVMESESGDLEALAGVHKFPVRIKCALLAWMTLDQALKQHQGSSPQKTITTEEAEFR